MTKTQELKNFSYFGSSHIGNVREENEDSYAHFETVNGTVFILCDGMGGIKGGKEAAEITIKQIEKYITEDWEDNPQKLLQNSIEFANKKVCNFFRKKGTPLKPGTTIVIVLIRDNKVYYAHVGDSRIYYQTGKKIFKLTKDHSYVMNLVDQKIITEEEAGEHVRRNEITKAIGIRETAEPTICNEAISPTDDDFILLCSDGLTNELSNKEILEVLLNNKKTDEKVDVLINDAIENGGNDNITVQLIRFYNTGKEANPDFIKKHTKARSRIKPIYLFIFILILAGITTIIIRIGTKQNFIEKQNNISKSTLLLYKAKNKDSLIPIFLKAYVKPEEISEKYHLKPKDIGDSLGLIKSEKFIKYYIPVKVVYDYRAGKNIYSYPTIHKKNLIDIIIVNGKKELYFKPGEKIIIPKKEN